MDAQSPAAINVLRPPGSCDTKWSLLKLDVTLAYVADQLANKHSLANMTSKEKVLDRQSSSYRPHEHKAWVGLTHIHLLVLLVAFYTLQSKNFEDISMADLRLSGIVGGCVTSLRCLSLVALFTVAIGFVAGYIVYQLYFHPLAKYPGPFLGRVTKFYDLYHAYIGDKHVSLYQLHKKYGTMVRFSPNILSINDPVALKAIYGHGANVQKSEFYKCFRAAPNAVSTLLATEKAQHARKRRVMGQAFSDQAVKGLEQYVLSHVQDLVDRIDVETQRFESEKQTWSKPLDMQKKCNWLVFDIMGDLVSGV